MSSEHTRAPRLLRKRHEISYSVDDNCIRSRTVVLHVTTATSECGGIHTARPWLMIDFLRLLQRDHHELEQGLDELLAASTVAEIRTSLDGVRLGLTAHAEAEDIVLYRAVVKAGAPAVLEHMIGHGREAHLVQEGALSSLVCTIPGSRVWRERARTLRDLVHEHAQHEENTVLPTIRELAPAVYDSLAGMFATERLKQLAMLQPSVPIVMPPQLRAVG